MNLLPKSKQDFSEKDYWNTFFKKRGKKAFEWYGEYPELCGHLHKYIKTKDEILMIGCGNSTLSTDLYDVGYRQITNIDISKVVIRQMQENNKTQRPDMRYLHMDALEMSFKPESFSVVVDKGTLDALMPDNSTETLATIDKLFNEISRVLRVGGRYVCVSLLQEHILTKLLDYFPNNNWMFRVVRCLEAEQKTMENNEGIAMPVFVVIATKFKQLPQLVLETCMGGEKMLRVSNANDIMISIKEAQTAALVCSRLNRGSVSDNPVVLELCKPGEDNPRFTIHVLDQEKNKGNVKKFAAFIVPQGRESDWLFSCEDGRQHLLKSVEHDRLAIVTMHRGQHYESWDTVQAELSENIKALKPLESSDKIPYLSLGSDVGSRVEIYKGISKHSGDYVIEEVQQNDNPNVKLRRLIFLNNQFVVQSEAAVKTIKTRNKTKTIIDLGHLSCQHHVYMTVGVGMAINTEDTKSKNNNKTVNCKSTALIVGLGGGGLSSYLHQCFKTLKVQAVEIDSEILKVAVDYFGLKPDDRLVVTIEDGINFILDAAQKGDLYNAILFDVDSKDRSIGMSCPPQQFIEENLLKAVKKCIGENGIFILNLVCRAENLRSDVIKTLKNNFVSICSYKLDQDLNEIIYCSNKHYYWKTDLLKSAKITNELTLKYKLQNEELVDVASLIEDLNIKL